MPTRRTRTPAKRHGRHQKHTRNFLKVYWPYMPLTIILIVGMFIATPWHNPTVSRNGVLSYATNTTVDGLLQESNNQRSANGKATLKLSSQLDSAAQAKAQDMVTRDYWSHTTPDGQQPWVFINATGYKYQKAGENLAYGFTTSAYTVSGWMNSPPHRENLLDDSFSQVGFGIANSPDYQHTGPETVVVAMYAQPAVLSASASQPASSSPVKKSTPLTTTAPKPQTVASAVPVAQPALTKATRTEAETTTKLTASEPAPQQISKVQAITQGKMPWIGYATGILTGAGIAALLLKHGLVLKRMLINGERFIYQHALFDVTIIAFVSVCVVSAHNVGVIR